MPRLNGGLFCFGLFITLIDNICHGNSGHLIYNLINRDHTSLAIGYINEYISLFLELIVCIWIRHLSGRLLRADVPRKPRSALRKPSSTAPPLGVRLW